MVFLAFRNLRSFSEVFGTVHLHEYARRARRESLYPLARTQHSAISLQLDNHPLPCNALDGELHGVSNAALDGKTRQPQKLFWTNVPRGQTHPFDSRARLTVPPPPSRAQSCYYGSKPECFFHQQRLTPRRNTESLASALLPQPKAASETIS